MGIQGLPMNQQVVATTWHQPRKERQVNTCEPMKNINVKYLHQEFNYGVINKHARLIKNVLDISYLKASPKHNHPREEALPPV